VDSETSSPQLFKDTQIPQQILGFEDSRQNAPISHQVSRPPEDTLKRNSKVIPVLKSEVIDLKEQPHDYGETKHPEELASAVKKKGVAPQEVIQTGHD
jgi:hypothetical protein